MGSNAVSPDGKVCIEVSGLWKVFGHNAEQVLTSEMRSATREDILEKTGCVVAVRDVSFKVHRGEFFVVRRSSAILIGGLLNSMQRVLSVLHCLGDLNVTPAPFYMLRYRCFVA